MFLFCSSAEFADLNGPSLRRLRSIRSGRGVLAWNDDGFTRQSFSGSVARVQIGGQEPVCSFEWDVDTGQIRFSRRWSGEFGLRYAFRPCAIVTSHLALAAAVLRRRVTLQPLKADSAVEFRSRSPKRRAMEKVLARSYAETARVVRELVTESVGRAAREHPHVMLSGGVDSSIVAAVAKRQGIPVHAFTYSVGQAGSDLVQARRVAEYLGIPHSTIRIPRSSLVTNIPEAVRRAATSRGTILDELAAHVSVARYLAARGISHVLTGEGADDLFGTFPFALRCFRGAQLKSRVRRDVIEGLPDELALLQATYSPEGVTLVHPYWTSGLRAIGYHLPLAFRVDKERLMKRVLRDAFADLLPEEMLMRPKGVPRDCTGIRSTLEEVFGTSRERYREMFRTLWTGKR
jgi:asparagine synthetase B (glutamine-hydrolysing)